MNTIGQRIALIRQERGESIRSVADRTSISAAYIHKIESGEANPTIGVVLELAQAFDMTIGEVFGAEKTENLPNSLGLFLYEYSGKFDELNDPDWIELLSNVRLRGEVPDHPDKWMMIFLSIRSALN